MHKEALIKDYMKSIYTPFGSPSDGIMNLDEQID
jgi:hypothetical protein